MPFKVDTDCQSAICIQSADGKTIKLSQSDKWFKQAKLIEGKTGKLTTTDTGIAFKKISK